MIFRSIILFLLLTITSRAADAFPPEKRPLLGDWTNSFIGVPGGIPSVTTVQTNISPGLTAAQIQTVINNAVSNKVIIAAAGVFNFGGGRINHSQNGVVIRGSTDSLGQPTTIFSNAYWHFGKGNGPSTASWTEFTSINISSGASNTSFSITLASAPNSEFAVGHMMIIDQLSDGTLVESSTTGFAHRDNRDYQQIVLITNISGSTIKFDPPLTGQYWSQAQDPEAFGFAADYSGTLFRAGFENIRFYLSGDTYGMHQHLAYGCWMSNCWLTGWGDSGGATGYRMNQVSRCEVLWNKFHDKGVVTSSSYALNPTGISMCRIRHNLFTNLALAMPTVNANGCDISYNVGLGPYPYNNPVGFCAEYFFPHGGHSHDTLYQGNWLEMPIWVDDVGNGNNSYLGFVRNRIQGWYTGKTSGFVTFHLDDDMDHMTILGNVLGWDGLFTTYADLWTIDAGVGSLIRTNNYNVADDGVNANEAIGGNSVSESYNGPKPDDWAGLEWPIPITAIRTNALYYTNIPAGFQANFGYKPTNAPAGGGGETGFTNKVIARPIKRNSRIGGGFR